MKIAAAIAIPTMRAKPVSVPAPVESPPVNTSAPVISGSTAVGSLMSCTDGGWTGYPNPTFTYQWTRDNVDIAGATNNTYTTEAADVGTTLRCNVTGTNTNGNATATSNGLVIAAALAPPVNTAAPVVSGNTAVGSLLSCTTGTWTGNPTPTYDYQWLRAGANISGANAATYTTQVIDEGQAITCRVTATNSQGNAAATSNAIVVAPPAGQNEALIWAGSETDVVAVCFDDPGSPYGSIVIRDSVTPANDFIADVTTGRTPFAKFGWTMTSPTLARDADGLLKFANHNVLLNSQAIGAWATDQASLASDVEVAPDGTMTADRLSDNAGSSRHIAYLQNGTISKETRPNFRMWLKAGTIRYAQLQIAMDSNRCGGAVFDLQAGVVTDTNFGSQSQAPSASMQDKGDGWWACEVNWPNPDITSNSFFYILGLSDSPTPTYAGEGNPVYLGDGNGYIYAWAAEAKALPCQNADVYIPTTDVARYAPFMACDEAGNRLGVLVEAQAANLCRFSRIIIPWAVQDGAVIVSNTAPDPLGGNTGARITFNGSGTSHIYSEGITLATNAAHTASVFMKWVSGGPVKFGFGPGGGYLGAKFDLQNGIVTEVDPGYSASMVPMSDGYYRCIVSGNTTEEPANYLTFGSSQGGVVAAEFLADLAQIEATAFVTSPIRTNGAQVSRAAPQNRILQNTLFNAGDIGATIILEGQILGAGAYTFPLLAGLDGSGNLRDNIDEFTVDCSTGEPEAVTPWAFQWNGTTAGISRGVPGGALPYGTVQKFAMAADGAGNSIRWNALPFYDDAAPMGSVANKSLRFGMNNAVGVAVYQRIKHVARRLSNAELDTEFA